MSTNEKCKKKQNLQKFLRFLASQGFAVVVVTFFDEILYGFHDFFGMCLFSEENQQPILAFHSFFKAKVSMTVGCETKRTFSPTVINEQFAEASSPTIFFL